MRSNLQYFILSILSLCLAMELNFNKQFGALQLKYPWDIIFAPSIQVRSSVDWFPEVVKECLSGAE